MLIIAAVFVQYLPLDVLRWLVLVVVLYASVTLLAAGLRTPARLQGDEVRRNTEMVS